jgi:hypothetical protein
MATTIKLGEEVTVGTTPVEYVIDETVAYVEKPEFIAAIYTAVANAGTIQFSVGVTPPGAQRAVAADKNVIMSGIQNGFRNLWAVGSIAGQKFTVS